MDHFAGLDVSVKETSVCVVDDTGKIVREIKVASEPKALFAVLKNPGYHFKRIGLEAGPLSQWLFSALAEAELPVIEVRTAAASRQRRLQLQTSYGQAMIHARGYSAPETTAAFARARELTAGIEDAAERFSIYYDL